LNSSVKNNLTQSWNRDYFVGLNPCSFGGSDINKNSHRYAYFLFDERGGILAFVFLK